jgi:hypothetical protein
MLIAVSSSDVEEKEDDEDLIVEKNDDDDWMELGFGGLNEKNLLVLLLKIENLWSEEGSETEQWSEEAIVTTQCNCSLNLIYSFFFFSNECVQREKYELYLLFFKILKKKTSKKKFS